MPTLLLVDDDARIRDAVARILADARDDEFVLIGAVGSVAEGIACALAAPPDVLLLDMALPDGPGTGVLAALPPDARTVTLVLTVFDDDEHVFEALRAGAVGYLLKDDLASRLIVSAREVLAGGAPMSPTIARRVLESFRPQPAAPVVIMDPSEKPLTAREREIVELLAVGATYNDIARMLSISTNTVRTHICATYRKLQVSSKVEVAREARRRGWIEV